MKKIAVIYNCFPHYRDAVVKELMLSTNYKYEFIGSDRPYDESIKLMSFPEHEPLKIARCRKIGAFGWQQGLFKHLYANSYDGYIMLGNAYFLNYWLHLFLLRLLRKPVWLWTHGWLDTTERQIKTLFKTTFYRLANGLLLYGSRAKEIGTKLGYPSNRLTVISNSLDFKEMSILFKRVTNESRDKIKTELGIPSSRSIVICSARLIKLCRFDLLISAAALLIKEERDIGIILVGDGPERENLEALAEQLCVPLILTGACYDEEKIARYYHMSDMSVSPGKVGLTSIHSLTYGTPVITHDDFDKQMPEFEAIQPGQTGDFFKCNNVNSLAQTMTKWFSVKASDESLTSRCRQRVENNFSPMSQVKCIEAVLDHYYASKKI